MKTKILLHIVIALVSVCLVVWLYTGFLIYLYSNRNELVKADAAVVLGASVWGEEPSPVFQARIDHGIWLYQKGYVKKLILTGGKKPGAREAESLIARRYAQSRAVPGQDILVETTSRSTVENLQNTKKVAEHYGLKRLIVVSDPFHMKRAMLMARDAHLQVFASPTPTTRYRTWTSKLQFLLREVYFYLKYRVERLIF